MEKLQVLIGFQKSFNWSFRKLNLFENGVCDGKNQLLKFWNERFMPEAFENPEGLSFGNIGILLLGLNKLSNFF